MVLPTGMLSTRAVEAYRLHPNRLKSLASRGQGYLFASRPRGMTALPIAYGSLGQLPVPSANSLRRIDQATAPGLRLYDLSAPRGGGKAESSSGMDAAGPVPVPSSW